MPEQVTAIIVRLLRLATEMGVTQEEIKETTGVDKPIDEQIAWMLNDYEQDEPGNGEYRVKEFFQFIVQGKYYANLSKEEQNQLIDKLDNEFLVILDDYEENGTLSPEKAKEYRESVLNAMRKRESKKKGPLN
jgi:hypothetical protein